MKKKLMNLFGPVMACLLIIAEDLKLNLFSKEINSFLSRMAASMDTEKMPISKTERTIYLSPRAKFYSWLGFIKAIFLKRNPMKNT